MPSRISISVLVGYGAVIWCLVLLLKGFSVEGFFGPITYVIGGVSLGLLAFDRYVWRWPHVNRLFTRPDLRGTWAGTLASDHPRAREPIEVFMVVHQTYSDLRLRLISPESQSTTIVASLEVGPDERVSVVAVYRNVPRLEVQGRSRPHRGTVEVMVEGGEVDRLVGEYWTDRKSTGRVELRRISSDKAKGWEHAKQMVEAESVDET